MTDTDRKLLALLKERSFKTGTFKLASGAESNYYIDGRTSAVNSHGAFLIGQALFEKLKDERIDAIGGLEVGAVPLTAAAVIHFHLNGRSMEGFWVRDKAKAHGMKKQIEGAELRPGSRVVILDDVLTTGGSAIKAVEAVREAGCEVVKVVCLVDRLQGARELFAQHGIPFDPLLTIEDFGITVPR
jgi:orotate phosphoribosyltransferase